MTTTEWLAAAVLLLLLPLELWFLAWQRSVNYPPKPIQLTIMQGVYEGLFVALAISVIWR